MGTADIAEKLGMPREEVQQLAGEALREHFITPADMPAVRARQLRMLRRAYVHANQVLDAGGSGELALKAIDRIARLLERESHLLGLDAPVRVDSAVAAVATADRELERLIGETRARIEAEERDLNQDT